MKKYVTLQSDFETKYQLIFNHIKLKLWHLKDKS